MEQISSELESIIAEKATVLWSAANDCFGFLSDLGFGPPRLKIREDKIFLRLVRIEYTSDAGRKLVIELAPASIKYDKDDAIIALIHKDSDARPKSLSVEDYICEHDKAMEETFDCIPRAGDYAASVKRILEIFGRYLQGDLRDVLEGKEWITGYDVAMA